MKVIVLPGEMAAASREIRSQSRTIAFVPTMGALHEGHLSLFREARRHGDVVAVSIFVNPTQFNDKADFEKYPKTLERDLKACGAENIAIVFTPTVEGIYPAGEENKPVSLPEVASRLEGASRPGHFEGVVDVVSRLFRIVQPHVAVFGLKDYQQYRVIQEMTRSGGYDVEIIGHPIVRTPEGLAMSSRNERLSVEGRTKALMLSKALKAAQYLFDRGERSAKIIVNKIAAPLKKDFHVDYVEIVDAESLESVDVITRPALLAMAVFVEDVRLIDNCVLAPNTVENSPT